MERLNVNKADIEELKQLPGIGPATAEKIVKARPIKSEAELERLVPPSAWLKLTEGQDLVFVFKEGGDPSSKTESKAQGPTGEPSVPAQPAQPVMKMVAMPETITIKRLMPGEELRPGGDYICVWNMRWGPQLEAHFPADVAVEKEVETKLLEEGVTVKFAHHRPSVMVRTPSHGLVPLVLFEILKEKAENGEIETDEAE